MNPQHIVYIGLVLVGIGITISAINPMKPLPDMYGNLSSDYFAIGIVLEETERYKQELIAPDTYRVTIFGDGKIHDVSSIPDYIEFDFENVPDSAVVTGIYCNDGHVERDIEKMVHNGVYYEC